MANQPSKYSKFLVGAASAALVASAVAPVASAADFSDVKGNTHEEAINALADAGVISGYPDGSFQPNKTLTRSDVVKLLGKWLVSEGFEIPADAVSNPRFTDLTSTSNKELLEYAAVVKDNGVFNGSNGRLLAADNITRENMAVVIVRAFDSVNGIDLVSYVNAQEFTKDVKDLNSAKAEAQGAINVLDFFDITNPAVANFNPKGSTTRGHFATFLHKSINTDFSKVTGVANAAVSSIKAVNATTVEITYKEEVSNVGTYTIEGLTVGNAAVKQTDAKTVVLTTTAQEGGKKYEVKQNDKAIGSFEGISAVIPTTIDVTTYSVQSKVGTQVTLSAYIGVKAAGVPVTFNVDAPVDSLNKDQIFEAVTDENGVATYSYTQYAPGVDQVAVYPTGAPTVRDFAKVFWGKELILTVDTDAKTIDNGSNRTYKVAYKDPATGLPVANKVLNVTFEENLNDIDGSTANDTDASVRKDNGTYVTPHQASTATLGSNREVAFQVTTNAQGEASFTVTGKNTKATPVVFLDENNNSRYEKTELQAKAGVAEFKGVQSPYTITFDKTEDFVAALSSYNGNENAIAYKLTVNTDKKDKDGKVIPYAGATIKVAIQQNQDGTLSNNTSARIADKKNGTYNSDHVISVTTNDKGEATFYLASSVDNTKATPVAWIDLNAAGANAGVVGNNKLEDGEPFGVASTVTFLKSVVVAPKYGLNSPTEGAFINGDTMTWTASLLNQSSSVSETSGIRHTTFTLTNSGNTALEINPKLVDENGRAYTNQTITYGGGTQTELRENETVYLQPGTTVTIHGVAPNYVERGANWNSQATNYSTTKQALLNVVAPDAPTGKGQLTVSSEVTTVKNSPNGDTRNDNNTFAQKSEVANFITSEEVATGQTVTGEVIGLEISDHKFGNRTNYGRVVVKERFTGKTKHYYYDAEDTFSAALDASLNNASTDNKLANASEFERLLSIGDEIQFNSTIQGQTQIGSVRIYNKDGKGQSPDGNTGGFVPTPDFNILTANALDLDKENGYDAVVFTFSKAVNPATLDVADFRFQSGTETLAGKSLEGQISADGKTLTIKFGNFIAPATTLTYNYAAENSTLNNLAVRDFAGNLLPNTVGYKAVTVVETPATPAQKEALTKAIADAKALNAADYTAASWGDLQAAVAKAEEVNLDTATGVAVEAATKAVTDAKTALVPAGTVEDVILSSLTGAYEIQDNTDVDKWGVVLQHDKLPADLQGGTSYTIEIDGVKYELTKNRFNANVFSGQVDSTKHTKAQVEAGIVTKN